MRNIWEKKDNWNKVYQVSRAKKEQHVSDESLLRDLHDFQFQSREEQKKLRMMFLC